MKTERISTETKEEWLALRAKDITSTEISSLFGCSPYMTPFELWHRKHKNMIVELDPNERMAWGTRLQDAIAVGLGEENSWKMRRINQYMRLPEFRLGSSFDFQGRDSADENSEGFLVEIKNVDGLVFRDSWIGGEAPVHIEIQLQQQMLVSGKTRGYIAALVGGNKMHLIKREADPVVHAAILERSAKFWHSVDNNQEPSPDWVADSDFIMELYKRSKPGLVVEADNVVTELALQHKGFLDAEGQAEANKKGIRSQIVTLIGEAEKCKGLGFTISAKQKENGSRDFRISWAK